jgi:hypothetical protein
MGKELSVAKEKLFAAIEETKQITNNRDRLFNEKLALEKTLNETKDALFSQGTELLAYTRRYEEVTEQIKAGQWIPKEEYDGIKKELALCQEERLFFKDKVASAGKFFLINGTEVRFSKTGNVKDIGWTLSKDIKEITAEKAYNLHKHAVDLLNKANDRIKKNNDNIAYIRQLIREGRLASLETIKSYIKDRFSKKHIFMFWKKKPKLEDCIKEESNFLIARLFK